MKILVISSSIPPITDMHTIRNMQFLEYLTRNNIKFDIVCSRTCTNEFLNQNSNIYYPSTDLLFDRISRFLTDKIKINIVTKAFNVMSKFFFIPDSFMGWAELFERDNSELIDMTKYSHIYSSSGSFFAHVIASRIKSRYKGIKWFADYGDPWGINKYGVINTRKSTLEIETISGCDRIFVTTESTQKHYSRYLEMNNINIPIVLFPCGYTQKNHTAKKYDISKFINISYAGVAFKKDRDLTNMFKVVGDNSSYTLNVCGSYSSSYKKYSFGNDRINLLGRLEFGEAQSLLEDSDVLLHIGNKGSLQIPGKTYILLSIPLPIIYIRQETQHDPTYELLKKMKGVVFSYNDTESIEQALNNVRINYENLLQDSKSRQSDQEFTQFEWTQILDNIIRHFHE